ncbi:amidohydrolase family protein [Erythrobacter donghaensis]|jgi:imidazolonepropionase-like amidohydrolase/Tol biopolymer transport system component|uniref:amidohydrolase family protein n=1 Tax=Erythrobacter donghaensis TaxID=267135 RepID=UPI00093E36B3|nr:amidohydrolase family protein [Erythrobacter donghaensis]
MRYLAAALLAGAACLSAPVAASAAPKKDAKAEEKWNVEAPKGATIKQVPINTDEGTWMDVDVAPDGKTIAFTLLGDIYTLPIEGGTPKRISEGLSWDVQPRFSPDGTRIAFTSDRGGGDNIWVMNADGSDKRQVTKEDFRLLNQPAWSPDGRFIAAKKHYTTERSAGTGEVWLYHVSGGGGVQVVERANERLQKELGEPVFAPDGSAIYYTRNTTPGPIFEYAQDSQAGIFAIERHDLATGEVTTAVSGYGGAVRPAPSPDGKEIAFVRRDKDQTQLWVKDIASGRERMIYGKLDLDVQETWAVTGVYPNMDWLPDSSAIVFWAGGKLNRVGRDGSGHAVIPFRVNDTRGVADAPHPVIAVAPDSFTTTMPRFATLSPDGSRVVFESLGRLYNKSAKGKDAPAPLTGDSADVLEAFPAFSRDGQSLAYVRWSDATLGEIVIADAQGQNRRVLTGPGHYGNLAFSPDGTMIAFEKREGGYLTSPDFSESPGIYVMPVAGGEATLVTREGANPQWGAANDRLFMVARDSGKLALISTDLAGEAKRTHAKGDLANDLRIAPDGRTIAFRQNYEVFAMPLVPGGKPVDVSEKGGALPVTKVSTGGADYLGWANGGETLFWSIGPSLQSANVPALFAAAPKAESDKTPAFTPPTTGIPLGVTVQKAKPTGTTVIHGARILTMKAGLAAGDAGVIEDGVIVIEGDRITSVSEGSIAAMTFPEGTRFVDASGKTIMPGLVDAHAHGAYGVGDLIPQQNWSLLQDLAMGVTTVHNPSSQASTVFAAAERQKAGLTLGPRIFSTGEIIYGAKAPDVYARIDSYEDALAHVRRIKAQGGISVKNYNQPRREQRQMVVRAAAAENMLVVAEGGSLFGMDMNIAADGNSTLEHNVPVDVFYEDVLQFYSQSGTNYTPTLVVTYGGLAGDPYWRQATNVWENPLMVHTPPKMLLAETARRTKAPEWAFVDDNNAREARKLARRGVKVSIGAHGQQAGIGAHWELWSFVRGGMSPVEALKAGTITSAQSLGMAKDIGSIEAGKLADLVILSDDPSADIANSDNIEKVMLGGRLYDAKTMNEVGTGDAKRRPYFWEGEGAMGAAGSSRTTSEGRGHADGDAG